MPPCASQSVWRVLHGVSHGGHVHVLCFRSVARRGASSGRVCPCCGPGFSFRVSKGAPQPAKGLFLRTCICMKLHADKDSEVPAAVAVNRIHIVVRCFIDRPRRRARARAAKTVPAQPKVTSSQSFTFKVTTAHGCAPVFISVIQISSRIKTA